MNRTEIAEGRSSKIPGATRSWWLSVVALFPVFVAGWLMAAPASGADAAVGAEPGAPSETEIAAASDSAVDPTLVSLDQKLDQLFRGDLPETVAVTALFDVPLDDFERVGERVEELTLQNTESRRRLSEIRAELEAIAAQAELDPIPELLESESTTESPFSADAADDAGAVEAGADGEANDVEREEPAAAAALEAEAETEASATRLRQAQTARAEALAAARLAQAARADLREQRRAELESEVAAAALRLRIAEKRLRYLERLEERLGRMTDASRRILPSLGKSRAAVRSHAADLAAVAASSRDLSDRMAVLSERSAAGMIVGFVSEQREISTDMVAAASAQRQQVLRLETIADRLLEVADALEIEGNRVRSSIFRSIALEDRQPLMDDLFTSHLRTVRRLRTSVSEAFASAGPDKLVALREAAESIAPKPLEVGTTSQARQALDAAVEHRLALDALASQESASMPAWELAFENELMTVLSEYASAEARADGYAFSREILDDVVSEASIAWDRTLLGIQAQRAAFPKLSTLATTPRGRSVLARLSGMLVIIAAWLFLSRATPKMTVTLVRSLSRIPSMRSRIGLLVRWSGLLQSVLPSLLALLGLHLILLLIGRDSEIAHLVRVLALPVVVYILGRQTLIGATRRITPGRPALIALRSETLIRLQRTYATLGIVIAVSYALDGLARVIIGAGRVVSLIDSVVLLWLGAWVIWEAIRWRAPLAKSWSKLLPESESESVEARVADWMAGSPVAFVLSPIALVRVVSSPIYRFFAGFASSTGFVQSLRARLLRRRSAAVEPGSSGGIDDLPEEYLAAFPLYPILGDDDALLVPRGSLIDDIVAQWLGWKETKADGSLALIGEKGAGKTTLAAQVARRIGKDSVVEHTIRGKPKTAEDLVWDLSRALEIEGVRTVDELVEAICAGEPRVFLLDEVHNVFLRFVDGYRAYDALVDVVNATTSKIFWVLIFNSFTWQFLNQSRGRVHYFRKLIHLPKWTPEEIQKLIRLRNQRTGYELQFDEMLLSDSRSDTQNLSLVEEAEGYFRLLWESSGGNPRIATQLWLTSLKSVGEKRLRVGLFPEPNTEVLSGLQDDLVFSLAAICQHENLSDDELALVLNVPDGFARFAMQFLFESKFIELKDTTTERYTLAPSYYRSVLRALRNKHLLFE